MNLLRFPKRWKSKVIHHLSSTEHSSRSRISGRRPGERRFPIIAAEDTSRQILKRLLIAFVLAVLVGGCHRRLPTPATGNFTDQELQQFAALDPIDAHTHVFADNAEFYPMLSKLHMHVLDILVVDDTNASRNSLSKETEEAWELVDKSNGHVAVCTTFDPYEFNQAGFAQSTIRQINREFDKGAVAVKIWKNIGMEIKDTTGQYLLPDAPVFEPIYRDIAAHNKTLITHLADPNSAWEPPNHDPFASQYFKNNPQWYMYGRPHPASKERILKARDHILEENPSLRVVGAHLGSMEDDFKQLGQHLDRYPNFAVDLAGRIPRIMLQPRPQMIAFIARYQDRLIYGTDLEIGFGETGVSETGAKWEDTYARDWRFLATDDVLQVRGHAVQGLALPQSILRKLYHENALHWFPGMR